MTTFQYINKNTLGKVLAACIALSVLLIGITGLFPFDNSPEKVYALTTGAKVPANAAAVSSTAGDNNGFESGIVSNVQTDNGSYMVSTDTGTSLSTTCALPNTGSDQHDFYNFTTGLPAGALVDGITVTLDGKYDGSAGTNTFCVFLSYDGGTSWTAGKNSADIATADVTTTYGGTTDTWGRSWTDTELNNTNFRVRVMTLVGSSNARDASLDYLAVDIAYRPAPPTLVSASNQTFSIGQATTSIAQITFTDTSAQTTAANDIRIGIATTTGFSYKWDTSDTTATIGGTAAAKVSSTVSYEGGGTVLVLNLTSALSAGETVTISDLSYAQFSGSAKSGTGALVAYIGGTGDQTADASDTATVSIKGSAEITNHTIGQVANKFEEGVTSTTTDLYRFSLTNNGEYSSTTLRIDLSSVSGIAEGDITESKIYRDYNGDGLITGSSTIATTYDGSAESVSALLYDEVNGVMYAGMGEGTAGMSDIYRCPTSTGCDASGDWTLVLDGERDGITALILDTQNNVIYAAMSDEDGDGDIYRCPTSTGCDASGDWTIVLAFTSDDPSVASLGFDSTNNILYVGGGNSSGDGDIYRCPTSTGCDASSDWTLVFDSSELDNIFSFIFDPVNNVMYAGVGDSAGEGNILRCDTSTGCDALGEWLVAYDGAKTSFESFAFDSVNNVLYAGQGESVAGDSDIYRCPTSTGCDASGDWTMVYDGAAVSVKSMYYNSANETLYAGFNGVSGDGDLYTCATSTGCDTSGEWVLLYNGAKESISAITVDASNNVVYFGQGKSLAGNGDIFRFFVGDYAPFSSPSVSIAGSTGAISFTSTTTLPMGTYDYFIQGTISNIASGDALTISLPTTGVVSYGGVSLAKLDVTGSVTDVTHSLAGGGEPGTLSLVNPGTAITNQFSIIGTSVTSEELYSFQLVPAAENISISNLTFRLSDIRGIASNDISSATIYIDYDGDGVVDAGDTTVASNGAVSILGSTGTIVFSDSYTATSSRNYLLRASVASIDEYDEIVIRLYASSIVASGVSSGQAIAVSGFSSAVVHRKAGENAGGGGGGNSNIVPVGDSVPEGDSVETGGGVGGGDETNPPPAGGGSQGGGGAGGGGEAYLPGRSRATFLASAWTAFSSLLKALFGIYD